MTKTQDILLKDNYAIAVPKFQANLTAEWDTLFVPGLTLTARTVYTGSQYVNAANSLSTPQWTRVDIGARYKTKLNETPVTLRANVENLFDKDPPCVGEEPNRANYAFTCEHASQTPGDLYNSTFDQLGRRYFVSMTMDF